MDIVKLVKQSIVKKEISIECETTNFGEEDTFELDIKRLQQVLLNILTNAIKFQQKGTISIKCCLK